MYAFDSVKKGWHSCGNWTRLAVQLVEFTKKKKKAYLVHFTDFERFFVIFFSQFWHFLTIRIYN